MVAKKKSQCLTEGCRNEIRARGLCVPCYDSAEYFVASGQITWAQLEREGKAKPVNRKQTAFTKQLKKSRPAKKSAKSRK